MCCFMLMATAQGQTKKELEKKKQQLQREIDQMNKQLKENKKNKNASLNQLMTLNKKINARKELISTMNSEINHIDGDIHQLGSDMDSLTHKLEVLKKQYADMLVYAYKHRNNRDKVMFVMAADNFNQAVKRAKYLQTMNEYRQKQYKEISAIQDSLSGKKNQLQVVRTEKAGLLNSEQVEKQKLDGEKKEQVKALNNLSASETRIKKQLREKQAQQQKLASKIENIIQKEIDAARNSSKKKSGSNNSASKNTTKENTSSSSVLAATPESIKLSNDFAGNKGRLPWPVESGYISGFFGRHNHPIWKDVIINNNGLDISSPIGSKAKAIFSGTVLNVFMVVDKYAVVIQHGEYFSVYSNLQEVFVKAGDKVSTKQTLGNIKIDQEEEHAEVHLEIWKGSNKMDPKPWIIARN